MINQIKAHSYSRHSHAITQATNNIINLHRLGDRDSTRTTDMRMHSVQAKYNNTDMVAEVALEIIVDPGSAGMFPVRPGGACVYLGQDFVVGSSLAASELLHDSHLSDCLVSHVAD